MSHKNIFLSSLFVLGIIVIFLIFALFLQSYNLIKILILGALVFSGILGYFIWLLPKKEVQEISTTLQQFYSLLEPLSEGVLVYQNNKPYFANSKFLELIRIDEKELKSLQFSSDFVEHPRYRFLGDILYPFIRGQNIEIIKKDPETVKVDLDNPERHYLITYTKITLDKDYEMRIVLDITREVIQLKEQKEFLSLVTHHLRTPLNHIKWFLESLDSKKLPPEDYENISQAIMSINSIMFTIEQLLLFASADEKWNIIPKFVSIKNTITKIIDSLKWLIEMKKLTVKIEGNIEADSIAADEKLFYLALYTFIENSLTYTPEGGFINIKYKALTEKPYNVITIQDSGIGIPENEQERIFQKHFRASNARRIKGEGLGIGLFLAKKILDSHGAKVNFSSKENGGTTFEIEWPRQLELIPTTLQKQF